MIVEVGQRWEPIDDCEKAVSPIIIEHVDGHVVVARWDHISRLRVPMTVQHIVANYRRTTNAGHN